MNLANHSTDSIVQQSTHLTLHPFADLDFSYKYGGGYNGIMVISLVYTPHFLAMESVRKAASNGRKLSITVLCNETRSGSVLQGKGSSNNEGTECEQSENTIQFLQHHQLASYEPAAA